MTASPTRHAILIVDDDAQTRRVIARLVSMFGYAAIEAADGNEAIKLFGEHAGVIVAATIDLLMPHTSGREVLAMLRDFAPKLPIVIVTGAGPETTDEGPIPGMPGVAYLMQPFTPDQLRAVLDQLMLV